MTTRYFTQLPTAKRIETKADIVFCMDATGSMEPCFEGVINGMNEFASGLQTAAKVDFRLRLIAYRDKHDPKCGTPWQVHDFTNSVEVFREQLSRIRPQGGGDAPESTLDALYLGIHSEWRHSKTHKTIVLLTDADTHPTLHPTTYGRPDNNIYRIIQDFQTLRHAMLFMVVPRLPAYERLERAMKDADRKIVANFVPGGDERYVGLRAVSWEALMRVLGQTVSQTSVVVSEAGE